MAERPSLEIAFGLGMPEARDLIEARKVAEEVAQQPVQPKLPILGRPGERLVRKGPLKLVLH